MPPREAKGLEFMKTSMLWIALFTAAGTMAASAETINAAGATFPAPIYQKWFEEFHKAHPDIQINYQAIGSGGGIRQLTEGTVDFGASDMPMTDDRTGQDHRNTKCCISRLCWVASSQPITSRAPPR